MGGDCDEGKIVPSRNAVFGGFGMRTEKEIIDLVLDVARKDENIRAVIRTVWIRLSG